ncbi:hypothetical protein YB2330_002668 [Saitoella coloradoensis]
MGSSCKDIREQLAQCVLASDCVMAGGNSVKDCLRNPDLYDQLPSKCLLLRQQYYDCRRGMIDPRKRFRLNAPLPQNLDADEE